MDVIGAKILSGILFFFLASFFGWMPYFCFKRCFRQPRSLATKRDGNIGSSFMHCLNALASGVLLATSLLHLLPESLEAVNNAFFHDQQTISQVESANISNISNYRKVEISLGQAQSPDDYFPVAECLIALGFLFIYIIEGVIGACSPLEHKRNYLNYCVEDDLAEDRDHEKYSLRQIPEDGTSQNRHDQILNTWTGSLPHKMKDSLQLRWLRPKLSTTSQELIPLNATEFEAEAESQAFLENNGEHDDFDNDLGMQSINESDTPIAASRPTSFEEHPLATSTKSQEVQSSNLRSVTLVVALCIHGFFDGVMLGLQTSLSAIMPLLLALSVHKCFVSIGLSLTLLSSRTASNCITLFYILLFASVAPIGLLISSAFLHKTFDTSNDRQLSYVPGLLQAFAVGTFLYVTFAEMLKRSSHKRSLLQVIVSHLCLLVGFSLMAVLRASLGNT